MDLGFEAHRVCPAGRAVRALPLPIPVAYGVKRQKAAICAKAGDRKSKLANRVVT